jgi:hypothetical protein
MRENGTLEITAPWWISSARIEEIVLRKTPWIERLRAHFRAHILRGALFRPDGIMLLGEQFKVVSDSSHGRRVAVDLQSKTITTGRDLSSPAKQANWLRAYAKTFLTQRLRELFEDNLRIEKLERASAAIDAVNEHFGKHTISMGTGLFLDQHRQTERDIVPWRKTELLPGETARQRLKVPRLAVVG